MRDTSRHFLVGLFSIVGLFGLAALLMSFGELEFLFLKQYPLTIQTNHAAGLRPGAAVEYRGVQVGTVDRVVMHDHVEYPVLLTLEIDKGIRLPTNVQPVVSTQLIGATSILQLRDDMASSGQFFPEDGTAMLIATMHGGMFAEITEQLEARMKPLLESLERFNRMGDSFVSIGDNLNELLALQSPEDLASGASPNLRTVVIRLNSVLDQARESLTLANSFLGDEQLRTDARNSIHRAGQLIDQATTAVDRYTELAKSLQTDSHELTTRLLPVMDSLALTLEDVRRLAKQANEGQGTIGLLLNRPDLYKSLDDSAIRLNRTLLELQALIEHLREEGVIINF